MHVLTSVTAISGFAPLVTMSGGTASEMLTNPVIDSREAETFVTVPNSSTLVMGGMRMIRTVVRERKIPGLADIKFLEWLFKSHRSQNEVTDLYFFIQPRIITPPKPAVASTADAPATAVNPAE